jgi:hypothetical protein
MAIDLDALRAELAKGGNGSDIAWRDIAGYLKLKAVEAQMAGGVTSYSINGRTVSRATLADINAAYDMALKYAAVEEHGGIATAPISFREPYNRRGIL